MRTVSAQGAGTVTVGLFADAISLDPEDTNDSLSQSIERAIYDGLLGFTPDMKIKPQLAVSWEASKDARIFTFQLRQGVRFHDGTPFNAQAVKLNFDRARDPKLQLKKLSLYEEIASVDVINDSTVRFTLRSPFGAMLFTFAHPSSQIISPSALQKGNAYVARNPVGTGPFKFASWTPGQEIVLDRNADFWEKGEPKVDRLVIKPVVEDASRIAMLLSGEAQFVFPVPGIQVDTINKARGTRIDKRWSIFAYEVTLNTQHEPYRSLGVRQALNYAIDKEAIVKVVLRGLARPLDAPMAPGVVGYSRVQAGGWPYDVGKAKALLAEAGFPKGFETTLWLSNESQAMRVGEAIQQMLGNVGVTVHLTPMEAGTLQNSQFKPFAENQSQMNLTQQAPSTGDADWGLRPKYDSSSWPPVLRNFSFYKNPDVDKLLLDALSTADQAARARYYAAASAIIWKDAPSIFLFNPQLIAGVRNDTTRIYMLPDGTMDLRQAVHTGT